MNDQSPSAHPREKDLFLDALDQPTPSAQAAYLDRACAGDAELRAAVEALLRSHREDDFLETPVVHPPPPAAPAGPHDTAALPVITERPGDRLGHYKLLQQIGEGGVGTVFMADQEEPVRRRVAVKVLKPGMDTKTVIARFETERQALAMMDHPNIARVLDAGTTATGRPYFVMELVRGIRITDYCDQSSLPTRDRLALFIQVCHAIQHAHQKGIIHRDIKPSNILVTLHDGVPVPKVIDFGIAKATDQRLTDKTLFTAFQAFIGTPAYMSPEQAEMSGLDIDTRADVYSLGVLLYEMLTSKTPFDPQELLSSGLDGMRRTIRERDPVPPSTRFRTMLDAEKTTTAQRHQSEPAKLASVLRGDLDWIVLKALEKDRNRRYETANDLALDVQRYLDDEPIYARPPSPLYRFQKLVRRNRLAFGAAAAITAALIAGLTISTWQYLEKSRAYRQVSEAERLQSQLRQEADRARRQAEDQALAARRKAYAADMNVVQQALEVNNLGRAQELLDAQRPALGQLDLRGWEWRYLWQHCQSDALFTLCRQSNEISSLTVSADGLWVAVSETGGDLSVWDLVARRQIAHLRSAPRARAIFSPVGSWLVFVTSEGSGPPDREQRVRLWDAAERKTVADLPLDAGCRGLAFSTNATQLLTIGSDDQAITWSVPEGARLRTQALPEFPRFGAAIEISRDLSTAAFGIDGDRIRVVDLNTGTERWTAQAAKEIVTTLAFSPDGKILASGAGYVESAIRLWDVRTGSEIGLLEGHRTFVSSLVFWPDGQTLASASGDQTIRLWDLSDRRWFPERPDARRQDSPHGEPSRSGPPQREFTSLNPLRAEPPPDSSPALEPARPDSSRRRRPSYFWRGNSRPFATLRGHRLEVWSLALLPDNIRLVSGSKDGSVCVWDANRLPRDDSHVTLPTRVRSWRIAPDSQSLLTLDQEGRVVRWQGQGFQEPQTVIDNGPAPFGALFSADARFLAARSTNGTVQIWDLEQRKLLRELAPTAGAAVPVAFVAPSNHLVTRSFPDSTFREWDLLANHEVRSWQPASLPGPHLGGGLFPGPGLHFGNALSADGQWWLGIRDENTGRLRNLRTGQESTVELDLKQIRQVAFSPDGRLLAAVSSSGAAGLWETATAQRVATLRGFLQAMNSAAFSPDGHRLAIGGDGSEAVKLWDVQSLQELLTLEGEGSSFAAVAFSADGNLLVASNGQGIVNIWRAASPREIADRESRSR